MARCIVLPVFQLEFSRKLQTVFGNPTVFGNTPFDGPTFKAAIDRFASAVATVLTDGGKLSRTLGRIEGELRGQRLESQNQLAEIRRLSERVRGLELWRAWMKAIGAALAAGHAYLCRQAFRLGNLF